MFKTFIKKIFTWAREYANYLTHFFFSFNAPLPSFIQLEPTTRCNCACLNCTRKMRGAESLNKDLSLEGFKKILSEIPTLKEIQLQGMGEPLMCPDLKKILEYGTSKGIRFITVSNGTMLSGEKIDLILNNVDFLAISLDAACVDTFVKIKSGASFENILDNIKQLMVRKRELKAKTLVYLHFVASHLNFKELPDFFKLSEHLGVDGVAVVEVENWLIPGQREYTAERQFISKSREVSEEIQRIVRGYDKRSTLFLSSTKRKGKCRWAFDKTYITADGFLTPCCIRMDSKVMHFGNVFESPFKDIWNGKEMKRFRKTILCALSNPVCDNCPD